MTACDLEKSFSFEKTVEITLKRPWQSGHRQDKWHIKSDMPHLAVSCVSCFAGWNSDKCVLKGGRVNVGDSYDQPRLPSMPLNSNRRRQSYVGLVSAIAAFQWRLGVLLAKLIKELTHSPTKCKICMQSIQWRTEYVIESPIMTLKPTFPWRTDYENLGFRYDDNITNYHHSTYTISRAFQWFGLAKLIKAN